MSGRSSVSYCDPAYLVQEQFEFFWGWVIKLNARKKWAHNNLVSPARASKFFFKPFLA
jgi:hypothetical protein